MGGSSSMLPGDSPEEAIHVVCVNGDWEDIVFIVPPRCPIDGGRVIPSQD